MTLAGSLARREPLPDNAPHVLLVDDDHRIRELLGRYRLRASGPQPSERFVTVPIPHPRDGLPLRLESL